MRKHSDMSRMIMGERETITMRVRWEMRWTVGTWIIEIDPPIHTTLE